MRSICDGGTGTAGNSRWIALPCSHEVHIVGILLVGISSSIRISTRSGMMQRLCKCALARDGGLSYSFTCAEMLMETHVVHHDCAARACSDTDGPTDHANLHRARSGKTTRAVTHSKLSWEQLESICQRCQHKHDRTHARDPRGAPPRCGPRHDDGRSSKKKSFDGLVPATVATNETPK